MKTSLFKTALFVAIAASASIASAQIKVSTGGATGTYSAMFKQLQSSCSGVVTMTEVNSSGSNENVDRLVGNQVNAIFAQTDVLFYRARTEDLKNVKTLLALHPEEVHLVAPSVSKAKEGGVMGIGGKTLVINTINDLSGRPVGAVGGSVTTAQVIRLQSEINFTVVQFDNTKDLMAALVAGTVQAALMVGGSPMADIAALNSSFKLLSIPEAVQAKLKGVYRPARLSYGKMGASGVQTVATDALFVTREYKTAKLIDQLARFRTCAEQAIPEIKETTGTHPKWQAVDPANEGKWSYYVLPKVSAK